MYISHQKAQSIKGEIVKYIRSKIGYNQINQNYWITFEVFMCNINEFELDISSKEIVHYTRFDKLKVVSYMDEVDDCIAKFIKVEKQKLVEINKKIKKLKI